MSAMLSPYRVLDLAHARAPLAGMMLADLGADVIAVEPPGGSPTRVRPPFAGDVEDPERNLYWWAYGRNKRGITLDLDSRDGQAIFRRLAQSADILIEDERPGAMAARGLGYEQLRPTCADLIYVSVSAFGRDGPKAGYEETDLILMAAAGPLILAGDAGQPPVRVSVPQAWNHAAGEAAAAAMVALHARKRIGRGQHVDISAQQSVAAASMSTILSHAIGANETSRIAGGMSVGPFRTRLIWPAVDGHISLTFLFGAGIGPFSQRLMAWIHECGECSQEDRDLDWIGMGALILGGQMDISEWDRLLDVVGGFIRKRTREELFGEARKRGLLIVPVTTVDEVSGSEQFAARDFWRYHDHDGWNAPVKLPGPYVRISNSPIEYRRRAPRIGEHNGEILAELGLSDAERQRLAEAGVI